MDLAVKVLPGAHEQCLEQFRSRAKPTAATSDGGLFVPRTLSRMIDTRQATPKPAAGANTPVDLVTPLNAAAAVTNITLTGTDAAGFATAYKAGGLVPGTSTLNAFQAGQTVANRLTGTCVHGQDQDP